MVFKVAAAALIVLVIAIAIGVARRPASNLIPAEPPSEAQAIALARAGQKIQAIKMIRELHGLDLKTAKDWVEGSIGGAPPAGLPLVGGLPSMAGVPSAAGLSSLAGLSSVAGGDEQVIALARQGKKIEAIKLMRQLHGIGLKEAKDWVDAAVRGPL